jgi:hypothetical protein
MQEKIEIEYQHFIHYCTLRSAYPKSSIHNLNRNSKDWYNPPQRTQRYADNCTWGIYSVNPVRRLGEIRARGIYVRNRVGRWSTLTTL